MPQRLGNVHSPNFVVRCSYYKRTFETLYAREYYSYRHHIIHTLFIKKVLLHLLQMQKTPSTILQRPFFCSNLSSKKPTTNQLQVTTLRPYQQKAIEQELFDGTLYARDAKRAAELNARNSKLEEDLMDALQRWETLST